MKFLKKFWRELLIAFVVLLALFAVLALLITILMQPQVLIAITGLLPFLSELGLTLKMITLTLISFAVFLGIELSLGGIAKGFYNAFQTIYNMFTAIVNCFYPKEIGYSYDDFFLDIQEEEGFWSKHWGKILFSLVTLAALCAVPYLAPLIGIIPVVGLGFSALAPAIQAIIICVGSWVALGSVYGIFGGLFGACKTTYSSNSTRKDYASDGYCSILALDSEDTEEKPMAFFDQNKKAKSNSEDECNFTSLSFHSN